MARSYIVTRTRLRHVQDTATFTVFARTAAEARRLASDEDDSSLDWTEEAAPVMMLQHDVEVAQ